MHSLVPPFFNGWVIVQILIYAFVAVVWRRRSGSEGTRLRLLRLVRRVAIIAATVPVSTFLANLLPWWRFPSPMLAVVASVALFVAVISAIALLGPWRRSLFGPPAVVSAATMLVLAADVMTGSRLQLSSLMGLQPVVGGRFYGMGNVTFALFATATLMLCIAVADHFVRAGRRPVAVGAVIAIGLAGVVVDASPAWGSDFGGPPAFLPALAFFVLAVAGVRLTWRRALLIGGGTVLFLVAIGFADWLRPAESRSHLGRFVQTAIDGGAATIILRKAKQNWDILTSSTLTLLVPIGLVFVIYILARPTSWGSRGAAPGLRAGAAAAPGSRVAARAVPHRLRRQRLRHGDPGRRGHPRPAAGDRAQRADAAGRDEPRRLDHARHASHATTAQTSHPAYGATERRTASVNASTPALIATTRPGT